MVMRQTAYIICEAVIAEKATALKTIASVIKLE